MMQGVNIILEENAKLRMALTAMTKAHDTLADQVALDTARIITVVQQLTEAQQEIARLREERDSAIDSFNAAIGRETQLMNQLAAMTVERDNLRSELSAWKKHGYSKIASLREELNDRDTVPRTRYNACNQDWLDAEAKLKVVQANARQEIERLTVVLLRYVRGQQTGSDGVYCSQLMAHEGTKEGG